MFWRVAIVVCCFFLNYECFGQKLEGIKGNSGSSSSGGRSSSGGGDAGGCLDGAGACLQGCNACSNCAPVFLDIFAFLDKYHQEILRKKDANSRHITSLELRILTGHNAVDNLYLFQPRLIGKWGLFATDIRLNQYYEIRTKFIDNYQVIDWQLLGLNLVAAEHVNLRWGNGFMLERFTQYSDSTREKRRISKMHYETTLTVDIYPDPKWQINVEGRFAPAIVEVRTPRYEICGLVSYNLFPKPTLHLKPFFGASYAVYYSIPLVTLQGGISLQID